MVDKSIDVHIQDNQSPIREAEHKIQTIDKTLESIEKILLKKKLKRKLNILNAQK